MKTMHESVMIKKPFIQWMDSAEDGVIKDGFIDGVKVCWICKGAYRKNRKVTLCGPMMIPVEYSDTLAAMKGCLPHIGAQFSRQSLIGEASAVIGKYFKPI